MSLGRRIGTYLLAALGGIAGAVLFWLATGVVADSVLGLAGMSPREGGRAMFAFFAVAPFGALLGFGLGVWMVLRARGEPRNIASFAAALLISVLAVLAVYGGVIGFYTLTDDVLVRNGLPPQLLFELRLPEGSALPAQLEGVRVDLDTDKEPDVLNPDRNRDR
jgi:MFS family permease